MRISASDIADLRSAKYILENPGLAAKIADMLGMPLEKGLDLLPKKFASAVAVASRKSVETALDVAIWTMDHTQPQLPSNWWHKLAAGTTGAAGGAFGLPALSIELPISTTIMLRSIADIARSEGENLGSLEGKLECVQVLALGGKAKSDDAAETGYFAARASMAKAVSEAARHLTEKGIAQKGAPAIIRLITQVASRFAIVVTEKAAAQAIPVVGAMGGAIINTLFIDHYQDMAKGHFIVRRIERKHGQEKVRQKYKEL
jgi:hypothetical protein